MGRIGWVLPLSGSRKWHYMKKGMSLCGKWAYFGTHEHLDQGNDTSPDNCAVCKRKRLKEIEKTAE